MDLKPYYETELGKLYHGDCLEIMPMLGPVDLVVTSPPYEDLRDYTGGIFDFKKTAVCLYEIIPQGGTIVWIVGDKVIGGGESGESFRQALYFKSIGFRLHDTMIYHRQGQFPESNRYWQDFEYMFVFTKGKIQTVNIIKDEKCLHKPSKLTTLTERQKDGSLTKPKNIRTTYTTKARGNIWKYAAGYNLSTLDKIAFKHPAIFPEALAQDHIISWSNEGDTVLDPMCGSGTTCKMAEKLTRRWIGIEIEEEYCEIAAKRIENERKQLKLF